MNDPSVVESILVAALAKPTAEARVAFLDEACKDDPPLRRHLEVLLEAHPKAVDFLDPGPAPDGDVTRSYGPARDLAGSVIADLFWETAERYKNERDEVALGAAGLQIDLDLAKIQTDPRVGLLRLARTRRSVPEPLVARAPAGTTIKATTIDPRREALNEFATMAVLAHGQTFAPLLTSQGNEGRKIVRTRNGADGNIYLTLDETSSARLWDPHTGTLIATLRQAEEKAMEIDLSPDGTTALTHSRDGIIRIWNAADGTFRAATLPRPGQVQSPSLEKSVTAQRWATRLSNSRILTWTLKEADEGGVSFAHDRSGPMELWDATTGQLIRELDPPLQADELVEFFGDGHWIARRPPRLRDEGDDTVMIYSSESGTHLSTIPTHWGMDARDWTPFWLSPDGKRLATARRSNKDYTLDLWDTANWRRVSTTGPCPKGDAGLLDAVVPTGEGRFLVDDSFKCLLYEPSSTKPVVRGPHPLDRIEGQLALIGSGQVLDTSQMRRLLPPIGRKYHADLVKFAPDRRFVAIHDTDDLSTVMIDTSIEKPLVLSEYIYLHFGAGRGWMCASYRDFPLPEFPVFRLPSPEHLNIPPDVLDLWAQVVVRGQLNDEGGYVPWDEPTWERKRQELAAKPAPIPGFPFPGHVASDRLHWLRQEYQNSPDAEKPRLARQLLDRAEATGDKGEATRWRAVLAPEVTPLPTSTPE